MFFIGLEVLFMVLLGGEEVTDVHEVLPFWISDI